MAQNLSRQISGTHATERISPFGMTPYGEPVGAPDVALETRSPSFNENRGEGVKPTKTSSW